jgi:hypothetical protein
LQAIPGVASAEVTIKDGTAPVARIWLDGSEDPEEVRDKVTALLGSHVPTKVVPDRPLKRSGLGRGLGDLLADPESDAVPPHINGGGSATRSDGTVERVAVVETEDGVHVEIEDAGGNRRSKRVGDDGSIDAAVLGAIRSLMGVAADVELAAADLLGADGELVVVTTIGPDGRRTAGAAFVDFGRPWALTRAATQALRDR